MRFKWRWVPVLVFVLLSCRSSQQAAGESSLQYPDCQRRVEELIEASLLQQHRDDFLLLRGAKEAEQSARARLLNARNAREIAEEAVIQANRTRSVAASRYGMSSSQAERAKEVQESVYRTLEAARDDEESRGRIYEEKIKYRQVVEAGAKARMEARQAASRKLAAANQGFARSPTEENLLAVARAQYEVAVENDLKIEIRWETASEGAFIQYRPIWTTDGFIQVAPRPTNSPDRVTVAEYVVWSTRNERKTSDEKRRCLCVPGQTYHIEEVVAD